MIRKHLVMLLIISALLISCGGAYQIRDAKAPASSMIYGYLNTANADLTGPCWVSLRHYIGERRAKRYIAECDELGNFWTVNLPAGTYKMEKFGNHSRLGDEPGSLRVIKNLRAFRDSNIIRIEKPGLYYFGSLEVSRGGSGSFGPGGQMLVPSEQHSESEILSAMLPHAKGTNWEQRISTRLGALDNK